MADGSESKREEPALAFVLDVTCLRAMMHLCPRPQGNALLEHLSAMLERVELVEGGTCRREHDRVTGLRDLAGTIERLFHARLEIRIDRAVRKGLVEALARLAIYDDSTANVRTSLDKLVKRGHFVPAAKQQHDLAIGESRERLESSIDVGCLRIVEEIDAIDTATGARDDARAA